jgi:hypothetical protein
VALFANPAVDRDYHAYRVMGDCIAHLTFAACLKNAPLLSPLVTSDHGPRLASALHQVQLPNKARKRLPQRRTVLHVTRPCFSARIGDCRRNAGPAEIRGRRFRKTLIAGGVYSVACAAYHGLEADTLPFTDKPYVICRLHRDVPTHRDLAALSSGGNRRGQVYLSCPSRLHVQDSNIARDANNPPTNSLRRWRIQGARAWQNDQDKRGLIAALSG